MIRKLITVVFIALVAVLTSHAQEPQLIIGEERAAIIDSLSCAGIDWHKVGLNGKLSSVKLPVRPTIKIYMDRGKEIIMSIRASIFGEIGRIEIVGEEVTVVNKHNRTYFKGSLSDLIGSYGSLLEDVQDFILGEPVIFGYGTVSQTNEKAVALYDSGDGALLLKPAFMPSGIDYGYVIGEDYLPALLLGTIGSSDNIEVGYYFSDSGRYMLEFLYQGARKSVSADIEFDAPDYTPKPIERLKIDGKYREVTVKEFLSRF